MILPCGWCSSNLGVKQVLVNGRAQPSPIPGVPLHLCYRCWGVYRETGLRRDLHPHAPPAGPITGMDLTPALLRQMSR